MQNKILYKYDEPDGCYAVSPYPPDDGVPYINSTRLVASEGKILYNASIENSFKAWTAAREKKYTFWDIIFGRNIAEDNEVFTESYLAYCIDTDDTDVWVEIDDTAQYSEIEEK